jgi:hypothetical protein
MKQLLEEYPPPVSDTDIIMKQIEQAKADAPAAFQSLFLPV